MIVMLQALTTYLSDYGVYTGARRLINDEGDMCLNFALQYFIAQVLMVFAALMIVVINTILIVSGPRPCSRSPAHWTLKCGCWCCADGVEACHQVRAP